MASGITDNFTFSNSIVGRDAELDVRPKEYKAFGIDDQVRPSNALIDFWLASGDQHAIAYSHLYHVSWKRSEGLVLTFSDHEVTLQGHGLEALYRGLKRHRVVYVWEATKQEALTAADDQPVITRIDVQPKPLPARFDQLS